MKYDLTIWQFQQWRPINKQKAKIASIDNKITSIKNSNLNEIKWVWEETIRSLIESWIYSKDDIVKAGEEKVKSLSIWFFAKRWLLNFLKIK